MNLRLALWLTLVAGCGHTKSVWDDAANRLCQGATCLRVGELGPGWEVVRREAAQVGFYNRAVGGVIQVNASCRDDAQNAPLEALTRQLLIGYTERKVLAEETIPFAGREARHTRVQAKLDGVPMVLDLYVLKRDGCIYDLSYAAPPDRYAAGAGDFQRFVGGFADERRPS
jgi:hypothetical protein